ncbi:fumarylacetoacetase [Diplodia corticola]|uniref:Fumarylacetoacetase n=1 Tax=Diplodia corticola TaxID=236234 RepID=A0A1J9QLY5_9PEZI|nr:fumarylacetoacetase [Diplodia corticola]OJD29918.1 fumarylacetoacetase [Diplodia corticola]
MGFTPDIAEGSPFTLANIPFGVFSTAAAPQTRCATAVGDFALDLRQLSEQAIFKDQQVSDAFGHHDLSIFAALPGTVRTAARQQIIDAIKAGSVGEKCFVPLKDVKMHLPMECKGYTDFFCSWEHCSNCAPMSSGKIPDNFFNAPSAYNGRASSVMPSPHKLNRPKGTYWDASAEPKKAVHAPSRAVDYELEMATVVSKPLPYGSTLASASAAADHIFGLVLLNDWSARDIQRFEMPPLGPFNSKAFGTTVSPWVVTLDALAPFAVAPKHPQTLASPLPYLQYDKDDDDDSSSSGAGAGAGAGAATATFDVRLSAHLLRGGRRHRLCASNLAYLLWTPFQQLAQQASSGCGLRTGDLVGTGTVSGDAADARTGRKTELACLFEATLDGARPLALATGGGDGDGDGERLAYLEDGDAVVLEGRCVDGEGRTVLGFGECVGELLPPVA